MFDIGFSEMLMVAIVALVVIGPERLPGVARNIGRFAGRLQKYVHDIKSDFNRELEFEEIRRLQSEMETTVQSMQDSMRAVQTSLLQEVKPREEELESNLQQAQQNLDALRSEVERLRQGASSEALPVVAAQLAEPAAPVQATSRKRKAAVKTQPVVEPVVQAAPVEDQYKLF